jgi:hypothetical protein
MFIDVRKIGKDEIYALAPEGYYFMDMYGHKYTDIMIIKDENWKDIKETK